MVETLSPKHIPSEPCTTERDTHYNGVFTTALEGGIGYWSQCSKYRWSVATDNTDARPVEARDFLAVIIEVGDGDGDEQFVIDRSVISRGVRSAHARGGWADYHADALRDLYFGNWEDVDYDADTADIIVQFGLFGEQRYS